MPKLNFQNTLSSRICLPPPSKLHCDLCELGDWWKYAPDYIQRLSKPAILARCRRGDGPAYSKPLGERGPAIFKRVDVLDYFKSAFSALYPDCIAKLLATGFMPTPEGQSYREKPKKPKKKKLTIRKPKREIGRPDNVV